MLCGGPVQPLFTCLPAPGDGPMTTQPLQPAYPSGVRTVTRSGVRAFTLIEVLVVIVIIGILATLVLTVAARVTKGGKVSLTRDTIRVLDQGLTTYIQGR